MLTVRVAAIDDRLRRPNPYGLLLQHGTVGRGRLIIAVDADANGKVGAERVIISIR